MRLVLALVVACHGREESNPAAVLDPPRHQAFSAKDALGRTIPEATSNLTASSNSLHLSAAQITKLNEPGDMPPDSVLKIMAPYSYAGLFAYILYSINGIIYAESNHLVPYVYYGAKGPDGGDNAFFDAQRGPNMWEYYFEPVSDYNPSLALEHRNMIELPATDYQHMHDWDQKSVFPYYYQLYGSKKGYDEEWYRGMRAKAHHYILKYIRMKPEVISRCHKAVADAGLTDGQHVLGVHIRGTDKQKSIGGDIIGPAIYKPYIDKYRATFPDAVLFLATDSPQFLEEMKKMYPDVKYLDAMRSAQNAFLDKSMSDNFEKGMTVLVDSWVLSRSTFLLKSSSSVSEFAIYWRPELHHRSLDLQFHDSNTIPSAADWVLPGPGASDEVMEQAFHSGLSATKARVVTGAGTPAYPVNAQD